jgi:hypothetical protein
MESNLFGRAGAKTTKRGIGGLTFMLVLTFQRG